MNVNISIFLKIEILNILNIIFVFLIGNPEYADFENETGGYCEYNV